MGIGDLNADGIAVVATANSDGASVSVLLGRGDGTLAPTLEYPSGGRVQTVILGDLNGDPRLDVVVTSPVAQSVNVLLNECR